MRRDRAYGRDLPAAADTKTVKRRKSSFFFLSGLINGNCCGILGINWRKRGAFHVLTGVTVPLTVAIPERIDLAQAARYFGAGTHPDPATTALLERCARPLLDGVRIRAVWRCEPLEILSETGLLAGSDIFRHLAGCGSAILLAVTLGPEADRCIRRAGIGDIAAGVATDALASALAEQAAEAAEAALRQQAAAEGAYLTGRFSPGYGDWPITVQPLLASALDTQRRIGLCVTQTDLLLPRKSVTALLGISDHPVLGQLAGCGHCALRGRCDYRKRGKTCAEY